MAPRIFATTGGGVRIGGSFGAELEGERLGKFDPSVFDYYIGTSSGSLDAALTANGWSARQKVDFFIENNFTQFFTPPWMPFSLRKALTLFAPIQLKKFADYIDGLNLTPLPGLLINAVDSQLNKQVVYCEKKPDWWVDIPGTALRENAFSDLGYGTILTRSMALPGLRADHPKFKDGGFAENTILTMIPRDADILMINLGYAGDTQWPSGNTFPLMALEDLLYLIEYKNYYYVRFISTHFPNLKTIYPSIFDVDSTTFNLTQSEKTSMVERAMANTSAQWQAL
ncbi:MAG: patatin-like phospholipase family protein [Vampirovibrionales bacterium]|nr:patatin-like phospholipase family protein [Vampirovibrionales bacterium]